MVLKSAFAAVVCAGFLMLGGVAVADEYRPDEFLRLDLSKVVLSPKRLGPEAEFAPVPIEARSDRAQADPDASVWPKLPKHSTHVAKHQIAKSQADKSQADKSQAAKPQVAKNSAAPPSTSARTRLAHRHGNPLDAQARDTRIQTWPCKSGGICDWQK